MAFTIGYCHLYSPLEPRLRHGQQARCAGRATSPGWAGLAHVKLSTSLYFIGMHSWVHAALGNWWLFLNLYACHSLCAHSYLHTVVATFLLPICTYVFHCFPFLGFPFPPSTQLLSALSQVQVWWLWPPVAIGGCKWLCCLAANSGWPAAFFEPRHILYLELVINQGGYQASPTHNPQGTHKCPHVRCMMLGK